jgi:hypothetical protein
MAAGNAATVTPFTENFFGADDFIKSRDIRNVLYPFVQYTEFMDFLFNTGKENTRKVKATANRLYHYEEDDHFVVPTIVGTSTGGGSAGAAVTFTINAIGSVGAYVLPYDVGDLVDIGSKAAGFKQAQITGKTVAGNGVHTYVARPSLSTVQIAPADAVAGAEVRYAGTARADGAYFPNSKLSKLLKYQTDMQIYSQSFKRHGSQSADYAEVEVDGKPFLFLRGLGEAYERLMVDIALQTLKGQSADNLTDPNHPDGNGTYNIFRNEGLEQKILNDGGINYGYTTSFDYSTDLVALEKLFSSVHGPNEYMGQLGNDVMHDIDSAMKSYLDNNGARYEAFKSGPSVSMKEAAELAASFRFKTVTAGNRVFHLQEAEILNARNLTQGTSYPEIGFFIPHQIYEAATSSDDVNLGIKRPFEAISIRYKDNGIDGSRYSKVIDQNESNLGADAKKRTLLMEMAVQFGMIRKFGRVYKA